MAIERGLRYRLPLFYDDYIFEINNKEVKNMDEKEIQTVEYGRGEDNNLPDPLEVNEDGN